MRIAFVLFSLVILVGCAAHINCPQDIRIPTAQPIEFFSYKPEPISPEVTKTDIKDGLIIEALQFKWADVEDIPKKFNASLMRPQSLEKRAPAIILMPPTEGSYDLLVGFGKFFTERGYVVLIIERRGSFFNPERSDPEYDKRLIKQTVIDIRKSIDWLQSLDYVDPEKIGILGVSLGAVLSELATAAEPRIKAAAFFLGSSDLDQVLIKSTYNRLIKYKRNIFKKLEGFQDEKMEKIRQALKEIEPKNYAAYIDPERVVFLYARFDAIVPRSISHKTICYLGKPKAYVVPTGHYSAFFFKNWALKKVFEHFEELFSLQKAS